MSNITGIVVDLHMGSEGTDDHMYVGVVGTGGGKEFALATDGFNDFESSSSTTYMFGEVWDEEAVSAPDVKQPRGSQQGANSPYSYQIDLDKVTQVYIRKGGTRKSDGDDRAQLSLVAVRLYGPNSGDIRKFDSSNVNPGNPIPYTQMTFDNEVGLQYWLKEDLRIQK